MDESTMFGGFYMFPWIWGLYQLLITGNPVYAVFLLAYGMAVKELAGYEHKGSGDFGGSDYEVLFDEAAYGNTPDQPALELSAAVKDAASGAESDNLMSGDYFMPGDMSKPMDGASGEDFKPGTLAVGDTLMQTYVAHGGDHSVRPDNPAVGDISTTLIILAATPDDVDLIEAPATVSPPQYHGSSLQMDNPVKVETSAIKEEGIAKPFKKEPYAFQPRPDRAMNQKYVFMESSIVPSLPYIEEEARGVFYGTSVQPVPGVRGSASRAEDLSSAPAKETGRKRKGVGKLLRCFLPCCCK